MKQQSILSAFRHAFNGLAYFFVHERNGRVQLCAAAPVIVFGVWLRVSAAEWVTLLLCIGAVLSLEMLNSSVEKLCDIVHKEHHPVIKIVKDVSAAAVLFSSVISIIIACIIFLPKIFLL
jgi:diacylglycerol kinase